LLQELPAFTAPNAGIESEEPKKVIEIRRENVFFMEKMVLSPIGFVSTCS
jgi:hypothetical protein